MGTTRRFCSGKDGTEENSMSATDRVSVELKDHVADVRLNRPEKLNALDAAMFESIVETGKRVAATSGVRAVVLSGEGRAFCAGLDFASFMQMAGSSAGRSLIDRSAESPANHAQRAAFVWREVPVPVIAALHGYAFGGGLQIALGADLRIISPDAELSVMEIKWGLVPDMTGTQTLRHLVRLDVAKELTFTGRRVGAEEAVRIGLATRVADDPRAAALELAREIAGKSPHAIRAAKELLDAASLSTLEEGLRLEERLQLSLIGSKNQIEAVQANMGKRPPEFEEAD
jgi:enoyl-CoA hydratase/carnithine racemase